MKGRFDQENKRRTKYPMALGVWSIAAHFGDDRYGQEMFYNERDKFDNG